MFKSNKLMDQQSLQEEYEESKIRLLMAHYAELEGKRFLEENEELRKDPFYLPSDAEKKRFMSRINRRFAFIRFKKLLFPFPIQSQKLMIALSAAVILLFTSVFTVEAVRVRVFNMFIQVQKEYTAIRVGNDAIQNNEEYEQIDWSPAFVPSKVPEGYHIVNVMNNQNLKVIEYKNDNNGHILFQQQSENGGMNVDTEDADEVIHTNIQGGEGLVIRKREQITVVWKYQAHLFLVVARSTGLNKEKIIELSESVTLLK
ncbi:DUF4367 domain-containing protein [Paenibacillus sp. YN15]|uniref:DUF4367 domain-containing protein n=1 Tax=Paenibacillus sp. YN15 TaxID=1742774 RepID=UPI0015EBDC61|nr:DUF4367 domain-containing protein [Paenibacillus sp. YN15]